ncbi:MAG TPA: hypothetical protein VGL57_14055 [Solirubrobacteraceae bacterium]|jgi:hypothetical protein
MIYKARFPIAVLAAAALALPPAASASSIPSYPLLPVPAGEVQHTVIETKFEGSLALPGTTPWERIEERWASAKASRSVLTNAYNGALISECTGTPSSYTCFNADEKDGTFLHGSEGLNTAAGKTWETEGARIKLEIASGWLRLTGSTTFLGRPAKRYAGTGNHTQFTVIADAVTDYPLQTTVALWGGTQSDAQVSTVTTLEILSPTAGAQYLEPKIQPGAQGSRARRRSGSKSRAPMKDKRHGTPGKQVAAQR